MHKYAKHLDKKIQTGTSVSLDSENSVRPREYGGYPVLEAPFRKLFNSAITPKRATSGSVGYNLYTPIDFVLNPQEQRTIFIDIAVSPPEGCYAQIMSKSKSDPDSTEDTPC